MESWCLFVVFFGRWEGLWYRCFEWMVWMGSYMVGLCVFLLLLADYCSFVFGVVGIIVGIGLVILFCYFGGWLWLWLLLLV